ncbi:MAG: Uncharacterised protein [Owenweeksia sp. TMED14]|nr:MAG: Uncharacterised protein [Owenweeksia sp. TMED14]
MKIRNFELLLVKEFKSTGIEVLFAELDLLQ